jgi:radical SAM superfamily enzyme YgiQ (UPF0313 family)
MKILFILPLDNTYHKSGAFTRLISYAPLTLPTLAALVPDELCAEMKIVDEGVEKPLTDGEFDIVAITCVTSSANRAYELCEFWKKRGSYTVLGGVHPTLMTEEAAEYADTVIIGLAEKTFPEFLDDFKNGSPKKLYKAENVCGYQPMPIPRRDLISNKYMSIPTVIASRGCHNHCTFCSIPKLYGNDGFARPIGEFIDEIKAIGKKKFIFLDPSLTSDRAYATELFRELISLKIEWGGLATIDSADDDELFELMVKSGCKGILAGFESTNQDSLSGVGKKTNEVKKYKESVRRFHSENIPILGCFVMGFDSDTKESLLQMVDVIDEIGVDVPRFSILTPFPGTPLFTQYKESNRIISENWDNYDTMNVVFEPKNMTPEELQNIFFDVWERTYKTKRILNRFAKNKSLLSLFAGIGFKYYARRLRGA